MKYNQNIMKIKFYMNRKNNKQTKIIKYNQNQIKIKFNMNRNNNKQTNQIKIQSKSNLI